MNMPTTCDLCEEWCEYDHMTVIENKFYCEECTYELEDTGESQC